MRVWFGVSKRVTIGPVLWNCIRLTCRALAIAVLAITLWHVAVG